MHQPRSGYEPHVLLSELTRKIRLGSRGGDPGTYVTRGNRMNPVGLAPCCGLEPHTYRSDSPASPQVARHLVPAAGFEPTALRLSAACTSACASPEQLANTVGLEPTRIGLKARLREPLCIRVQSGEPVWNRTTLRGFGVRCRPRRTGPTCYRTTTARAGSARTSPGT